MSEDRKPFFRFNPNAYLPGRTFESSDDLCEVCKRPSVWKYTGSLYAVSKPVVCASCIATGRLEALLGRRNYRLHDIELDGAKPELADEVLLRTPGIDCFNPFEWPVLDGWPLSFLHYGEDDVREIWQMPEVIEAVRSAYDELGWDDPTPGPYVMLFKEIAGDQYRVCIDLD